MQTMGMMYKAIVTIQKSYSGTVDESSCEFHVFSSFTVLSLIQIQFDFDFLGRFYFSYDFISDDFSYSF